MKIWKKYVETRKELSKTFSDLLRDVPQDSEHHPEGPTLIHTQLVRKAVPKAIEELRILQQNPKFSNILSDIDFSISPEEMQILKLSAWLHDIGKYSATTIGGQHWTTPGATGKIQAIGHQDPEHYHPQLEKLKDIAPPETVQLYLKNEHLINFIIEHHMDFTSGTGFSKSFVANHFERDKIKNTPEMKLLLILMWADKMGRKPEDTIKSAIEKNANNLYASMQKSEKRFQNIQNQTKAFEGGPEEFSQILKLRKITRDQRIKALQGKFPYLTGVQLDKLTESFRTFLEMDGLNPTTIHANIPIDDNVKILSKVLKQGDSNVSVYVVGGAVRDYLYHVQYGKSGSSYKPKDIDLTTNLSEKDILSRLRNPYAEQNGISVKEKESVDTFGVVFATVNQENYEIAPFRKDIGGSDGRRPDSVEIGTIQDDAMRRDLTINNLYYDFDKGLILDFNPGGQGIKDIENRTVRCVGNPNDRFKEDKLRVLRLVRFFSRFNPGDIKSVLDPQHIAAIEKFKNLEGITPERVQLEFLAGINQSLNTAGFLKSLADLDLLKRVFPQLNIDAHDIGKLGNLKNVKVILAWLLRNNQNVNISLKKLKYPNDISESVRFLINSMNFDHGKVLLTIKDRDKRLLKGNAFGPSGKHMSPQEIQLHNQINTAATQQDLKDLAKVVGDSSIASKLTHFGSYQPPNINSSELMNQGFKGLKLGAELDRRTADDYKKSLEDFNLKNKENID